MKQADLLSDNPRQPQQFSACGYYCPDAITAQAQTIIEDIREVVRQAPLRHFSTPGGKKMGVLSSNCGDFGWVSDNAGYRYSDNDPLTGKAWPNIPQSVKNSAVQIALACGFESFTPDACLINVYRPGVSMGLHQDKDESDFSQPIVSFSLGLSAIFLWGGSTRSEPTSQLQLSHGDGLVWGGSDRLKFHGIRSVEQSRHPLTGDVRINLTLRKC